MLKRLFAGLALLAAAGCGSDPEPVADHKPEPYRPPPELAEIQRLEDSRVGDERLSKHLKHADPLVRRRACLALGRVGAPSSVGPLGEALKDADAATVVEALFALGQVGRAEAFERVQPFLKSEEPDQRAAALEALGKLGDPAYLPYVGPMTKDRSERVRAEVPAAMMRLAAAAATDEQKAAVKETVLSIKVLLRDPAGAVRMRTAYALARVDASPAAAELEVAANDPDPLVRTFAVRALGKIKDFPAAVFVRTSRDSDERVVYEAVNAMAAREGDDVVAALRTVALAGDFQAVARAIEILGERKAAEPATLKAAARHPYATVQAAALVASARVRGAEILDDAIARLQDPRVLVRRAAARALVIVGGDRARQALGALFTGTDRAAQTAVLEAFAADEAVAKERQLELDSMILAALKVNDAAVRGTAVDMLKDRKEAVWERPLEEAYRASTGDGMYEIREIILAQLESMGKGTAVAEAGLKDPEYAVRLQAAKTLKAATGRTVAVPEPEAEKIEPSKVESFAHDPVIKLRTSRGEIRIRLLPDAAPVHVTSTLRLVREGFYDGKTWHRVVPDFVIQGGDPRGDGWGDAGFKLRCENSRVRFEEGFVGMARAGKDTGSCQLFITHVPTPHLDGKYTVFGKVVSGMDVVKQIEVGDVIEKAEVER